jgi:hypothetical protein
VNACFFDRIKALLLYNYMNSFYLFTFVVQLKTKRLHINRILAALLLCVFAIALTPWSSLHHHEEEEVAHCINDGRLCMHKVHIGSAQHNCLICAAHFEKDYQVAANHHLQILPVQNLVKGFSLLSGSYTELISTSLRGPPAA